MKDYRFINWLKNEHANFGFESFNSKMQKTQLVQGEDPIHHLDTGYVLSQLKKHKLGILEASRSYFSEVTWGEGVGAIKFEFTPLGGSRVMIRKLCLDLEGNERWVLKKVIEARHLYDLHPDTLVENSLSVIKEIASQGIDSPSNEYKDLERLVLKMTPKLRSIRQELFFYEGIRRVENDKEYIIHFGVHGSGVQKMGQRRLETFHFNLSYHKNEGFIKIIGQEIDSSLGQHQWRLDQASWIEYFMPNQPIEEIVETQVRLFHSY